MKIFHFVFLLLKLIILVLIIILAINNHQPTEFNLLGIYIIHAPLIVLIGIAFILGSFLGIIMAYFSKLKLKHKIQNLEKRLNQVAPPQE